MSLRACPPRSLQLPARSQDRTADRCPGQVTGALPCSEYERYLRSQLWRPTNRSPSCLHSNLPGAIAAVERPADGFAVHGDLCRACQVIQYAVKPCRVDAGWQGREELGFAGKTAAIGDLALRLHDRAWIGRGRRAGSRRAAARAAAAMPSSPTRCRPHAPPSCAPHTNLVCGRRRDLALGPPMPIGARTSPRRLAIGAEDLDLAADIAQSASGHVHWAPDGGLRARRRRRAATTAACFTCAGRPTGACAPVPPAVAGLPVRHSPIAPCRQRHCTRPMRRRPWRRSIHGNRRRWTACRAVRDADGPDKAAAAVPSRHPGGMRPHNISYGQLPPHRQ